MQSILDAPDTMLMAGEPITLCFNLADSKKQLTIIPPTMIHIKDLLKELQRQWGLMHFIRIIPNSNVHVQPTAPQFANIYLQTGIPAGNLLVAGSSL